MPSVLIGKSVGDVFYPWITEASHKGGDLAQLITKTTLGMAAVGVVPYGAVVAFGPWLFSFIFGKEWLVAGEYARYLSISMFFIFVNIPSTKALPVLSAQFFHLKYTLFSRVTLVSVLFAGFYIYKSDTVALILYSLFGSILNVLFILIVIKKSKKFQNLKVT